MFGPIKKGKDKSNKKCALTAMIVRFGKAHFNLCIEKTDNIFNLA